MDELGAADRGISPVIGVILLVGMVVILAATIGVYVLGFSDQQPEVAPQIAIVADYDTRTTPDGESLTLAVESGEVVERANLELIVTGAKSSGGSDATLDMDPIQTQAPTQISAGVEFTLDATHFTGIGGGEHLDLSEVTVRLVWQQENVDDAETYVIYRWPDPSKRQPG